MWTVTAPPYSNSMAGHQFPGYIISNNMWNCQGGCDGATDGSGNGTQTIWANSASNWGVTATLGGTDETAVLTYPEDQQLWSLPDNTDTHVANLKLLQGHASEVMPQSNLDAEAAYDIWLGPINTPNAFNTEVMIWTENHGQTPAGHVVGSASWYGQNFTVWSETGNHTITFVQDNTMKSGTTHILSAIHWLANNKFIPKNYGLAQVDFGFEICNTGGTSENFNVTSYNVTSQLKS